MKRSRLLASAAMLLSGVTHTAQFLLLPPSPTNSVGAAVFGGFYLVVGVLLLRPTPVGLWLGATLGGIGGLLGGLATMWSPDPLALVHAALSIVATVACLIVLFGQGGVARFAAVSMAVSFAVAFAGMLWVALASPGDAFAGIYDEQCSVCHGDDFAGTPLGPPLVGRDLVHGDSLEDLAQSIARGFPSAGMPAGTDTLEADEIQVLALLISERRAGLLQSDLRVDAPLEIPEGVIESEAHAFQLEVVASGLGPRPFSIAPLPDGRILLSEKSQGLRILSADGQPSEPIEGTPPAHGDGIALPDGLVYGHGWMLDVALHPEYEANGWVYLQFGDRCETCATSMNKLVRGRIVEGRWVDQETVWEADPASYTDGSDIGAGGRIAFDDRGHVFLSVGIKGRSNYHGIQDLGLPYGKIHRVHDDGRVPEDNPFVGVDGALPTTWTRGHRSPQGLEFDAVTGRLWSTEMGPRGGDELNLLEPGGNYGWPLTSKGLNYDGTPVAYGERLGIEVDPSELTPPVLDMTPAPAISSFVVYRGDAFPRWEGDLIAGSLKATALYRWVLDGDRVVHRETLLERLARIRDVETGPDGALYLLLEHGSGAQVVRMVAVD